MCHDDELTAFREYARVMPNNCVFLVDTYDTLQGVRHAVTVGRELRRQGHEMIGIRLDSGDLAALSIEARRILDEGGFPKAAIVASNDLDERIVETLKEQDAKINVWGVGTRLITGSDDPALGGVYKLSAIRRPGEAWQYKVKLSEQTAKVSTPGVLQVRRFYSGGVPLADAIIDENAPCEDRVTIVDPLDMTRRQTVPDGSASEDLLVPVFRNGRRVYDLPDLASIRSRAASSSPVSPGRSSDSSIRTSISSAWSAACTSARRGSSCRSAGSSGDAWSISTPAEAKPMGDCGPNWPEFNFFLRFRSFSTTNGGSSFSDRPVSVSNDMGETRGKQGPGLLRGEHIYKLEGGQKSARFWPFPILRGDWRYTSSGCWAVSHQPGVSEGTTYPLAGASGHHRLRPPVLWFPTIDLDFGRTRGPCRIHDSRRCKRLRLSRNHHGIRVGTWDIGAALMIVWSGEGNCASSARRPLAGAVDGSAPLCAARVGGARRRAELSKNKGYGHLSKSMYSCQGARGSFFPRSTAPGRPDRRKWFRGTRFRQPTKWRNARENSQSASAE